MELEIGRGLEGNVSDAVRNATSTVTEAFNNALEKGMGQLNLQDNILTKAKEGLQKFNIKEVASKTIDTAMKSTLKSVAGVKATTVNSLKDLGKAIRDSNLKAALRSVVHIGVNSIKALPSAAKKAINSGVDFILGDTFDDELKKVMTTQKNTLSRMNNKCKEFEKAYEVNDEKAMKKYATSIAKDLEKVSLISETIDKGKEIVNRYELMKNKGSTQLSQVEQELLKQIS